MGGAGWLGATRTLGWRRRTRAGSQAAGALTGELCHVTEDGAGDGEKTAGGAGRRRALSWTGALGGSGSVCRRGAGRLYILEVGEADSMAGRRRREERAQGHLYSPRGEYRGDEPLRVSRSVFAERRGCCDGAGCSSGAAGPAAAALGGGGRRRRGGGAAARPPRGRLGLLG